MIRSESGHSSFIEMASSSKIFCAFALAAVCFVSAQTTHATGSKLLSGIPFSFERNAGQFPQGDADWVAHRNGYHILLGAGGASILPAGVKMQFAGAHPAAKSEAQESLPGKVNYLIGNDPKRWVRDVETCRRVVYHDVYTGVDVAWYGSEGQLEYDLVVRPGADTSRIALHFEGARKLSLAANGDLRIETSSAPLTLRLPAVYQESAGARTRVESHYVLRDNHTVAFALATYDKSRPLVIDPTLVYAAEFSGENLSVARMATDSQGNIYVGGNAQWLPTVSGFQSGGHYSEVPFVEKFDPTGTTILYSTFVSGTVQTSLMGFAVDSTGHAIATGMTGGYNTLNDFPLVNAAQSTCNTGSSTDCGFAFRLNTTGNGLVFSTYISSTQSNPTYGDSAASDSAGNAYVAGYSFVNKYATDGSIQYASTLIGGTGITVDSQGSAYLAGVYFGTSLQGIPGARDLTGSQCTNNACTYVAKLSADGTTISWEAVLGSTGDQSPGAIIRDPNSGLIYVAGSTTATDLPTTAGVVQPVPHGGRDGFLASLAADGSAFGFVTYLGGSADDSIGWTTLTADGHIVVTGSTWSPDFPVSNALQSAMGGGGASLFTTTDYGATWTAQGTGLPVGEYQNGMGLSVDPSNPSVIVAASQFGLFRTTNGGASWSQVGPPGSYEWNTPQLSRSLANPEVMYAVLGATHSPYSTVLQSTDGGMTWTSGASILGVFTIVAGPQDANTVTVVDTIGHVYISTDGGGTFSNQTFQGQAVSSAVASPDGSIYVPVNGSYNGVTGGFVRSTDNGNTWKVFAGSPDAAYQTYPALAVCSSNPAVLYADGGLYRSMNTGATWVTLNSAQAETGVFATSNCHIVYAIGYGSSAFEVSLDSGSTWSPATGNLTMPEFAGAAVDPTNPAHAWVAPVVNPDGFIAKVSNDGKTLVWSTFFGGSGYDDVAGVFVDGSGNVWIAGTSNSADLPGVTGSQSGPLFLAEIADTTPTCTWQLNPQGADLLATGGPVGFGVTTASGCAWTATPSATWISTSQNPGGTGSGSVNAVVYPNNTGAVRTGSITVGGQTFAITQAPSNCRYALDRSFVHLPTTGGQFTVNVTTGPGCPWDVVPSGLQIVSGGSGTGVGSVTLSAAANGGLSPVFFRPNIASISLSVILAESCTYSLSPLTANGSTTSISMTITASSPSCNWYASSDAAWLSDFEGTGSYASFTMSIAQNPTGAPRSAHIYIGSQTFLFTQSAGPVVNNRSFVSALGSDANACTVSAPCRTLSQALTMTNPGGEIVVVNSGEYNPATIMEPVTVSATGVTASITATSGSALTINTPGNVTITGLGLHGQGSGVDGVLVQQNRYAAAVSRIRRELRQRRRGIQCTGQPRDLRFALHR